MKNSKKIIVAVIVLLILLVMVGVAFAYVYVATDVFRTDKELFFTYFAQITSEDGFADKRIQEFNEKKKQTPYENSGEIIANVQYPDESMEKVIEKVNDLSIKFSGKTDLQNQKVEKNIEVDYGNDVIFPISYRQDVDKFGLQFNELSKQYIAIKNENLDELIGKVFSTITVNDISGATESIDTTPQKILGLAEIINAETEVIKMLQFTETEKNELQLIYGNALKEQLLDENFSRAKNENSESYTLELTYEQIKKILIKMLEVSKENTLIIDKINEMILEQEPESKTIDAAMIDSLIESLNEEETSDVPNLKITLVQSNKQLNQIILQQEENVTSILKNKAEDSLSYDITLKMKEVVEENTSILQETKDSMNYNAYFNIRYSGLQNLENVQENYGLGFATNDEEEAMRYDYTISNNTEFKESISVEDLNEDVAVFLNEREGEEIRNFLTNVGTKLLEINKNQMIELGLEEYENPLLYSNPITMLVINLYNAAVDSVNDVELSSFEKMMFNDKFEPFVGNNVVGAEVNSLMQTVLTHNQTQGEDGRLVKITVNGEEKEEYEKVSTSARFIVEAIYDEDGYVTEMKVTNVSF